MSIRSNSIVASLALVLAGTPAMAQQQAAPQQLSELAASDFRCFALMGAQRDLLLNRTDVPDDQKTARLAELNVLTAFFNGRASQYNENQRTNALTGTTRQIRGMDETAMNGEMQRCTQFYLGARQTMTAARATALNSTAAPQ
ncbi:MAG: hypothetical protein AAGH53_12175 [Pseudomonadota bacterium]